MTNHKLGRGSLAFPFLLVFMAFNMVHLVYPQKTTLGLLLLPNEALEEVVSLLLLGGAIYLAWRYRDDLFTGVTRWLLKALGVIMLGIVVIILLGEIFRDF
ncbi:hypothetical protein J5F27_09580 [Schleiferilactobacillus harbinensis]|jgi:phosphoglycerol transferase MdoB-like AlkP superfamily enzyme|uniref:hypothetical protein n=1 Tax=Schleiferilactobacillus harbinensis TaxID=304207 RepID=UPI00116A39BE|nr:hypothetical protein [Schleiferilactobacillus harbinensis]MBO3092168.1 hypothetical protein [Schleiferilactobacillus harbinensis]GEK05762.1 hypothetical protein LHA01_10010 [Schleiferilactobacillus harbinensis]